MVTVTDIAEYMCTYIDLYRQEYNSFIQPHPFGGGYPALRISPFLASREIKCYLAADGVIITASEEPDYIRPANPARLEFVGSEEYRRGDLPPAVVQPLRVGHGTTRIEVTQYNEKMVTITLRLTCGAFGFGSTNASRYWTPTIIRDLYVKTPEMDDCRSIYYAEFHRNVNNAAWDQRGAWARVAVDVRHDFAHAFAAQGREPGLTIDFSRRARVPLEQFFDRLTALNNVINEFERLLKDNREAREGVFHDFIQANPILLDAYGIVVSKPRFEYPVNESPLGKEYVEPDFVIRYPNTNLYKLVEIEKPSKRMATNRGHATKELSQPMFQISEWWTFISKYPHLLQVSFPGISAINCQKMVIMSRSEPGTFSPHSTEAQNKELLRNQFGGDVEILTYDDLLNRAKLALIQLSSLGVNRF